MILPEKTSDFKPKFTAVGCYCIYNDRILYLQRQKGKDYPEKWNLPGGKVEKGETVEEGVKREIREETGIILPTFTPVSVYLVRYPEYDYIYHTFKATLPNPHVTIKQDEILSYDWFTPQEALLLDLVPDEDYCIKDAFGV